MPALIAIVVGVLAGAVAGAALGPTLLGRLARPSPIVANALTVVGVVAIAYVCFFLFAFSGDDAGIRKNPAPVVFSGVWAFSCACFAVAVQGLRRRNRE